MKEIIERVRETLWRLHGVTSVHFVKSKLPVSCPDCQQLMQKIFVCIDETLVISGWCCGCTPPENILF